MVYDHVKTPLLTSLAVQGLGELVDCRRNLQTFVENGALPLQADVTGPFNKACQITLGLNILACSRRYNIISLMFQT